MTSEQILFLYVCLFGLYLACDFGLTFLNLKYQAQRSNAVPEPFREHIELATYKKSIAYTRAKAKLGVISEAFGALIMLGLIFAGAFGIFDRVLNSYELGLLSHGVVFVLALTLFSSLTQIPFSLYSTFVVEEKFGFNKMTFRLWALDFIKGTFLSLVILTPLLYGLFWFMQISGQSWWVYAFIFVAAFQLCLAFIFPVWIAPLFNKFEVLPDGDLKTAIQRLAQECKFKMSGVFQMDGSKRSVHANAYFTGLGGNKRIVLYDTLIKDLSTPETVAVLAHEIGHQKLWHVPKGMLLSLVGLAFSFWCLSLVVNYPPFFHAFGFENPSNHAALIVLMVGASPLTYFLSPLFAGLSRIHEYAADRFAVNAVGTGQDLIEALIKLSKKSLSNLTPHPLYSFFHYSHPTLLERIRAMQQTKV